MPTTPIIVAAVIIGLRAAYQFGGESVQDLFQSIRNFFMRISPFGRSAEAGKEYVQDKVHEMEKDEKIQEKEKKKEERAAEKEAKQKDYEMKQEKARETAAARQESMKPFLPQIWGGLQTSEKMDAVLSLVKTMSESMNLQNDYSISFHGRDGSVGLDAKDGKIIIGEEFITSNEGNVSIDLLNGILKTLAYARQEEVLSGDAEPTERERAIAVISGYNEPGTVENINIPKVFFLNRKLEQVDNVPAASYITASPSDSYERQAIAGLQPSERIPNMIHSIYFLQFKKMAESMPDTAEKTKEFLDECAKYTYYAMRDSMNKLYGCRNIETEIDKAVSVNSSMRDKPEFVNKQVLYAVSVYQAQSYAESCGADFEDPREGVIQKINGSIPDMSEKQYSFNKGRLEYENISVDEVLKDEEYEKRHPKKEWTKNEKDRKRTKESKNGQRQNDSKEKKDRSPKEKDRNLNHGKDNKKTETKDRRKNPGSDSEKKRYEKDQNRRNENKDKENNPKEKGKRMHENKKPPEKKSDFTNEEQKGKETAHGVNGEDLLGEETKKVIEDAMMDGIEQEEPDHADRPDMDDEGYFDFLDDENNFPLNDDSVKSVLDFADEDAYMEYMRNLANEASHYYGVSAEDGTSIETDESDQFYDSTEDEIISHDSEEADL